MYSKHANIFVLLAAIASFLPVLSVDYVIDHYARVNETAKLQQSLDALAGRIEDNVHYGIGALRRVLADSPSLCTPTFIANAQKEIEQSLTLKDFVVENADGVQYCDALGRQITVSPLSGELSLPGHTETVKLVKLGKLDMPVFMVTQAFGATRRVSTLVPVMSVPLDSALSVLHGDAAVRIALPDGTPILSGGPPTKPGDWTASTSTVNARSLAGDVPIRASATVPFASVRADYADLDVAFTAVAALMAGALLLIMLQIAKRAQLPMFDLERAIADGEIKPYYQPVIDTATGRLAGCEVLVRWEKRSGETAAPGPFINYAEMTGLAVPMTLSVMRQVKADLAELCAAMPDIKVSINLFDGHFRDTAIVDDVQAIFAESPIGLHQLVFEITERRPLPDVPSASAVINGLHALGARLALDDAGTGHSNLAFMQTLGVDIIKIDRIFIEMIKPGTAQVPVLDGLIGMARDLGAQVIAEGIETQEQALYMRARGVHHVQGFLFAPALKRDAFVELAYAMNGPDRRAGGEPAEAALTIAA